MGDRHLVETLPPSLLLGLERPQRGMLVAVSDGVSAGMATRDDPVEPALTGASRELRRARLARVLIEARALSPQRDQPGDDGDDQDAAGDVQDTPVEPHHGHAWRREPVGSAKLGVVAPVGAADLEELKREAQDLIQRLDTELEAVKREREAAAQSYFEHHAAQWDEIRSLHVTESAVESAMRAALGPGPFRHFVDAGTGTGRVLQLFAGADPIESRIRSG